MRCHVRADADLKRLVARASTRTRLPLVMNHPDSCPVVQTSNADSAVATEAREWGDYLAGQDPLAVEAAVWAARRQDGLSAEEEATLQAWLAGDPARGARLDQLTDVPGQLDQ